MTTKQLLRRSVLVAFVIAGLCWGSSVRAAPSDTGHLVVLMYHRFDAGGSISTPMDEFKRQINYLKSNDYNFVSLTDVRKHLRTNKPFPEKSVLITIDDGFKSTYTHAYPFLKKKQIPWALYIYTEAIEKSYPSALTWDQIREMSRNGATVGNHTYSHTHPVQTEFRSGDWVNREILGPHEQLQEKLEKPVFSFAIPYGEYDRRLMDVLNDTGGYRVVWGIDPGPVDPRVDRSVQPRYGINGTTSWSEFKKKLRRLPLGVESVEPQPGAVVRSGGDTLRITLSHPERYRRGPINIFYSELGRMEWSWSEDERTLIVPLKADLTKDWNRIIVTAYDHEFSRYRFFSAGFPTADSE